MRNEFAALTGRNLTKILGLALGCTGLLLSAHSLSAGDIRANGGTTWVLGPTDDPSVFTHTVDGVVQVSLMGNCNIHADVVVRFPTDPSKVPTLNGSFTFTAADGVTTLKASAEGTGTPDPANPSFLNFQYHIAFTGGSGQFTNARGEAIIKGVALFITPSSGKATWELKGSVEGVKEK
jgi:hypothetical protein